MAPPTDFHLEDHDREAYPMARTEAELTAGIDDDFKRVIQEMIDFFSDVAGRLKGRATYTTGAAARGVARIITPIDFPPDDFLSFGKVYPIVVRHATPGPQRDDRFLDGAAIAIKFYPPGAAARTGPGPEEVGIQDLMMNTGRCLFVRTARDFNTMVHTAFVPGQSHGETRRPLVEAGIIDDDLLTEGYRTGSYTEFYYHSQICFEFADQAGGKHYIRFRSIPADRGPERGLFPPTIRARGETFGPPWPDDRRAPDHRRTDFEVRANHLTVNYLLQAQVRPTDDPEAVNCKKVWDERHYPWVDVAHLELNQALTVEEVGALEFDANRTVSSINLPLARTADDHASLGHSRALVYWHARQARIPFDKPQPAVPLVPAAGPQPTSPAEPTSGPANGPREVLIPQPATGPNSQPQFVRRRRRPPMTTESRPLTTAGGGGRRGRTSVWRRIGRVLLGVAILIPVLAILAFDVFKVGSVALPRPPKVDRVISVNQNWKPGWDDNGAQWFHHVNQGTRIMPYDWFVTLRQPEIGVLHTPGPLASTEYLSRFGFLPSETNEYYNPDGLPIGFAIDEDFVDPYAPEAERKATKVVGLSCASCHTGQVTYRDGDGKLTGVLIEGGSAMTNLRLFQEAVGKTLFYTKVLPWRFDAFAREVLGRQGLPDDAENRGKLRAQLQAMIDLGMKGQEVAKRLGLFGLEHGFSRTDALALIGNRVFGTLEEGNLAIANAPVNFPSLWDTPWFDWVQYNASIQMPLVRNIGESLGVGALVNLDPLSGRMFESTVDLENLHKMENLLGGDAPPKGLHSPRWVDAGLPPIDAQKAERGRTLYGKFCLRCHMPPIQDLWKEYESAGSSHWTEAGQFPYDKRFLKMPTFDIKLIGTDPAQALNLYRRVATVGPRTLAAVEGLQVVTEEIRYRNYTEKGLFKNPEEMVKWDRWRNHVAPEQENIKERLTAKRSDDVVVDFLKYKANPLNGIWATPPYFHNSSIPNLYEVLLPQKDRSSSFYLGCTELDTKYVGFVTTEFPGGFRMDTTLPGNLNSGHEFRDPSLEEFESNILGRNAVPPGATAADRWARVLGLASGTQYRQMSPTDRRTQVRKVTLRLQTASERGDRLGSIPGLVGPELTDEERWALVEYLKTL
jgi:hypothetical protein